MPLRASEVFAPRRKRGKPEQVLQKAILVRLHRRGCLATVTDAGAAHKAGGFFGSCVTAGWPDITGMLPGGRFIGIEVKSPKGRQSTLQKMVERAIRGRGGLYVLARSCDDVEAAIAEVLR